MLANGEINELLIKFMLSLSLVRVAVFLVFMQARQDLVAGQGLHTGLLLQVFWEQCEIAVFLADLNPVNNFSDFVVIHAVTFVQDDRVSENVIELVQKNLCYLNIAKVDLGLIDIGLCLLSGPNFAQFKHLEETAGPLN